MPPVSACVDHPSIDTPPCRYRVVDRIEHSRSLRLKKNLTDVATSVLQRTRHKRIKNFSFEHDTLFCSTWLLFNSPETTRTIPQTEAINLSSSVIVAGTVSSPNSRPAPWAWPAAPFVLSATCSAGS